MNPRGRSALQTWDSAARQVTAFHPPLLPKSGTIVRAVAAHGKQRITPSSQRRQMCGFFATGGAIDKPRKTGSEPVFPSAKNPSPRGRGSYRSAVGAPPPGRRVGGARMVIRGGGAAPTGGARRDVGAPPRGEGVSGCGDGGNSRRGRRSYRPRQADEGYGLAVPLRPKRDASRTTENSALTNLPK
jgi:hypothetical protein